MSEPAEAVHRRYYGQVYRYVRRRTRTAEDAEDLTQSVFADAVAGLSEAGADSPPVLAWLYTVARRRLIDERRRGGREKAQPISLDEARVEQRGDPAYGFDVARAIAEAIAALPPEQRQVVVLKLVEGRRFDEIARRTGASEQTCRQRLSRALRTLRVQLEEEGLRP